MSESVIFNSPFLLFLYGAAFFLWLFGEKAENRHILPVCAAFIVVGTTAYAILSGAELWEAALVLLVFLTLGLSCEGNKK